MTPKDNKDWFEAAWEQREETIYRQLFGDIGKGIYPLDINLFEKDFNCQEIDPRWLHVGVFECPPTKDRKNWVYVTSGLSNAWEDEAPNPNDWSGLGGEFLIQTVEQSKWALFLARKLAAYQILLAVQHFGDRSLLEFGDRMAPQGPIDGDESALEALVVVPSPDFGGEMKLLSGTFEFLQVVGITPEEHAYAKQHGSDVLQEKLLAAGASPVIDPMRESIV